MKILFSIFIILFTFNSYASSCRFMSDEIDKRLKKFNESIEMSQQINNRRMREDFTEAQAREVEVNRGVACQPLELKKIMLSDMEQFCQFENPVSACHYDESIEMHADSFEERIKSYFISIKNVSASDGTLSALKSAKRTMERARDGLLTLSERISLYKAKVDSKNTSCSKSIEEGVLNYDCVQSLKNQGHIDLDQIVVNRAKDNCTKSQIDMLGRTISSTMEGKANKVCEAVEGHQRSLASTVRIDNVGTRVTNSIKKISKGIEQIDVSITQLLGKEGE